MRCAGTVHARNSARRCETPGAHHMLGVLKRALLIIVALCAAAGPLQAQEWTAHSVPLFMSVTNPLGHQGFVRVINHSEEAGEGAHRCRR